MAGISHFNSKYIFPHSNPVNFVLFLGGDALKSISMLISSPLSFLFLCFPFIGYFWPLSSFFAMNPCLANFPGKHQFGKKTGKIFFCIQGLHEVKI